MPKLHLTYYNKQRKEKLPDDAARIIMDVCKAVLTLEKYGHNAEISVNIVDPDEIKALNKSYRGRNRVTDVLSFPVNEANPENDCEYLGDVVICAKKARAAAYKYGHSFERELAFLAAHSVLHLLGYDHENDNAGENIMREKQRAALSEIGLSL